MFDYLNGEITRREPPTVVLDVNGVGYALTVPLSSLRKLPASGSAKVLVHVHSTEDSLRLYGFASAEDRDAFRMLIGVSRVGPALAVTILSGCDAAALCRYLAEEDTAALTRIKGIGKRLAERLVVELKPMLEQIVVPGVPAEDAELGQIAGDAVKALISLGDRRKAAEAAVREALKSMPKPRSAEELTLEALRYRS